jgi:hypothetical protein
MAIAVYELKTRPCTIRRGKFRWTIRENGFSARAGFRTAWTRSGHLLSIAALPVVAPKCILTDITLRMLIRCLVSSAPRL